VAAIQPSNGSTVDEADVQAYLKDRIASYKIPRIVKICSDFPREDSGKVKKHKLRDQLFGTPKL
jgi:long-chain acyl-CoA synthetase